MTNEIIYENKKFIFRILWIISVFATIGSLVIIKLVIIEEYFAAFFVLIFISILSIIIISLNARHMPRSLKLSDNGINIRYMHKNSFISWRDIDTIITGTPYTIVLKNGKEIVLHFIEQRTKKKIYDSYQTHIAM